jgi:hypothetical protein
MFGPSVIGDKKFKEQQEQVEKAAHIYGPRVTGIDPDAEPEVVEEVEEQDGEQDEQDFAKSDFDNLTVADVRSALAGNAAMVDPLLDAELAREKPRKSALKSILEAENGREPAPRVATVQKIEEILEGMD